MKSAFALLVLLSGFVPGFAFMPGPARTLRSRPVVLSAGQDEVFSPRTINRRELGASLSAALAASLLGRSPRTAFAETEALTLDRCVYLILRVQEGTQQEERLISTGKFKDLERANVKSAASMLLKNYQLDDCVTQASKQVVDKGKIVEALESGRAAVDALTQINEYFDSSDRSLQVNQLAPDKQAFVLKALGKARSDLDNFLSYLPNGIVTAQRDVIAEENDLNKKEYKAPDGSSEYLNPPPPGASK